MLFRSSRAMKELIQSGHIVKEASGELSLTARGRDLAEQIYENCLLYTSKAGRKPKAGVLPEKEPWELEYEQKNIDALIFISPCAVWHHDCLLYTS